MDQAWETWWATTAQRRYKSLLLLVIWGCWLARNSLIFQHKACTPEITSALTVGIFTAFPQHIRAAKQREVLDLEIDKENPWGFFDGVAQNDVCGGGALLFLSDTHFFELSFGLGEGTNNFVEFMSLKILLIFAAEQGCRTINVFGNSMTVINWVRGIQQCRDLRLADLLSAIGEVLHGFDTFPAIMFAVRENNK